MEIITHTLRAGDGESVACSRDIAALAERMLAERERCLGLYVDGLQLYVVGIAPERDRTRGERLYDLLTLGVLWRVYGGRARRLGWAPRLLAALSALRGRARGPSASPAVPLLTPPAVRAILIYEQVLICSRERIGERWRAGTVAR